MYLNDFSKWLQYNRVKNLRGSEYFPYPLYAFLFCCFHFLSAYIKPTTDKVFYSSIESCVVAYKSIDVVTIVQSIN